MKTRIGIKAIWLTILIFTTISTAHAENHVYDIQIHIRRHLNVTAQVNTSQCSSGIQKTAEWTSEFYAQRAYFPAWIDSVGLKPEAAVLFNAIRKAELDGLSPKIYPLEIINCHMANAIFTTANGDPIEPSTGAQLDIALSTAFFLHAMYLSGGRVEANYLKDIQAIADLPTHLVENLEYALNNNCFESLLSDLSPQLPAYKRLKVARERYETITAAGGWPTIPPGPKMELGLQNNRVALLRARLMTSQDLHAAPQKSPNYFDFPLQEAVLHFQRRHGLTPDGVVGPETLKELNVSCVKRLEQILINLERWHQLPRDLGDNYIEVNIPEYRMKVVELGREVRSMRVIVGRENRPTPVLAGRMTYLEVNPYWTVPPQIAKKDILPKIQQDPSYLIRKKIRVFENWQSSADELDPLGIDWSKLNTNYFPYKLRQEPAGNNALGQIKFMFPNKMSVYLHDTPSKELFQHQKRSFSSGCVRLEHPLDLAVYLLEADKGWNKERLTDILGKGKQQVILLNTPIPVYLFYWTAWVQDGGEIHFRKDIYGRDQALAKLLKSQSPDIRTCQKNLIPDSKMVLASKKDV